MIESETRIGRLLSASWLGPVLREAIATRMIVGAAATFVAVGDPWDFLASKK